MAEKTARGTGIGASVRRVEDARFLTGRGRFVDDFTLANTAHAYVLRSPHAHARIGRIDTAAALAAPGVLAVLTGQDVHREGLGDLPCRIFMPVAPGTSCHRPTQPILVADKVRHVGDRVALVVAETLAQAKDAAELIEIDYQALPAAASLGTALDPGAPKVWDEAQSNLCAQIENGDAAVVARAFAGAAHVTRLAIHYPRASANPIEPRAVMAVFDRFDRRTTLYSTTQAPFRLKDLVGTVVLGIPETDLRVVAPDIGGAFGMKGAVYPEDALVAWAAGKLDRPVKWTADRSESLMSDMHGRDLAAEAELALDAEGRILALRADILINVGAYLGYSAGAAPTSAGTNLTSVYDVKLVRSVVRAVFTNTSMLGPYRGSGRPEATFIVERLVDKAARELGIDPVEMRRRNLVPSSAMPYRTHGGHLYDCGEFEMMLDQALRLADWPGFAARREASARAGKRRGIGLGMHCESSGLMSERMEIRVEQSGAVAIHVGTLASGQGHETVFAQMISEWLGVPFDHIRILQGDTDRVLFGRGTYAERSMIVGGSALRAAADIVIAKGKNLAAWMLEAAEADIAFADAAFTVAGTDRGVTLVEVARKAYSGIGLPPDFGLGLDGAGVFAGPSAFPNGAIIAEVEVDTATGTVTVEKLASVDDVGVALNPMMLDGQLHGSIAQGLGQMLVEEVCYDPETGQLLTGSFMDYGMPRADIMPPILSEIGLIPAKTNPLGVKGGSEAGNMAAPPAIINAIIDALAPLGVTDMAMPATPERVWRAIRAAARAADDR